MPCNDRCHDPGCYNDGDAHMCHDPHCAPPQPRQPSNLDWRTVSMDTWRPRRERGRDPNRIPYLMQAVHDYLMANPGIRLGQLLANISRERVKSFDPFNMEDDEVVTWLRQQHF